MVGKTNGTRDTVAESEGEREPDEHQIVPQESLLAQVNYSLYVCILAAVYNIRLV